MRRHNRTWMIVAICVALPAACDQAAVDPATLDSLRRSDGNPMFGYGMRNAFGFCFDPKSGKIYATENGPDRHDAVQVVLPGSNQGSPDIQGMADDLAGDPPGETELAALSPDYVEPLFDSAVETVVPTGIAVNPGSVYGPERQGNVFYGEWRTDVVRRHAVHESQLADPVESIVFLSGFGEFSIDDLDFNPTDQKLYVLTPATLYRVDPN